MERLQVRPVVGEIELERLTVPLKRLTRATAIVEAPATPASTVIEFGLADTVKSCTWGVTFEEWDTRPLVPVTVER